MKKGDGALNKAKTNFVGKEWGGGVIITCSTFLILLFVAVFWLPIALLIDAWFFTEDPDFMYGEFPMELTYEINGETHTVNEIYVVEYYGYVPTDGHHWTGHIQSTGEAGIVLYEEENLKVICELGDADYYTGFSGHYEDNIVRPRIRMQEEKSYLLFFKKKESTTLTEEELYDRYGIKLIRWTTAPPVEDAWKG